MRASDKAMVAAAFSAAILFAGGVAMFAAYRGAVARAKSHVADAERRVSELELRIKALEESSQDVSRRLPETSLEGIPLVLPTSRNLSPAISREDLKPADGVDCKAEPKDDKEEQP